MDRPRFNFQNRHPNKDYFEGVLQLRNCTEEAYNFIANTMEKDGTVWIAKEIKIKDGVDLYVSSNKFLKKIGKLLRENFPGEMKSTSRLFTRDRQSFKDVYRGTVLFRMPSFRKGDRGIFNGEEVEVVSIGERVVLKDVKTGKKMQYRFDDVNKTFKAC